MNPSKKMLNIAVFLILFFVSFLAGCTGEKESTNDGSLVGEWYNIETEITYTFDTDGFCIKNGTNAENIEYAIKYSYKTEDETIYFGYIEYLFPPATQKPVDYVATYVLSNYNTVLTLWSGDQAIILQKVDAK